MFYYLFGYSKMGKPTLTGPFTSDSDEVLMQQKDKLKFPKVYELETRDPSRAKSEIAAKRVAGGSDMDSVLNRHRHQVDGVSKTPQRQGEEMFNREHDDDNALAERI